MNSQTKNCQNCKNSFVIEPEDFDFYAKIQVPPPTFCPQCRMQRRMAFRNQNKLFKVKDAFTGVEIFSLVPPESGIKVVTQEEWFSDSWDALEYGQDIDWNKPFLSQLFELHKKIPQMNLNVNRIVNSPYSGNATDLKNCYLVFNADGNENCMYGTGYYNSKYCVDNCDVNKTEFCYGSLYLQNCSKTYFSEECIQCSEVWFSKNCTGCLNIVGCVNLRNKSYCIFNEQYSREDYLKKVEEMKLNTWEGLQKLKQESYTFWKKFPKKYFLGIKNLNSTGVYVTQSKNVKNSYLIDSAEDTKYSQLIGMPPNRDCYDISVWGDNSELCYEYSASGSGVYNSKFLVDCWPDIRNTEYTLHSRSSSNLFGCVGLQKKQYCILNKQYTKEEYGVLVEKIKQHMIDLPYVDNKGRVYAYGEFFPIEFSWYGYNNTLAQEIIPLTKEYAEANGYAWYEIPPGAYTATINAQDLPSDIHTALDTITQEIIQCQSCIKKYRIIQDEFEFLKREGIPLPHNCPDCRYAKCISHRLKPTLFTRTCMHEGCSETFQTGYNPKDNDIVYCESHYQQEVA